MQGMRRPSPDLIPVAFAVAAAFGAFVIAAELVRPFTAGPVGFDSAASVIHFQRIASGRTLEAFVTATPKPLLTLVYGGLHELTGDWRSISWATIAAFAVAVGLASRIAWRLAGPAAAVATVVGLVGTTLLLEDVVISYAVPWALVGWLVAALAVLGPRPRPLVAGLALMAASLARLETLVVVAVIAIALAGMTLVRLRRDRSTAGIRRWWGVLLGAAAVPVMLVHDLLLTGDPWFWMSVSARYSAADPDSVRSPLEIAGFLTARYLGMPLLLALGSVGVIWLARVRQWPILVGLVGLGPGVAAFLVVMAARGTYVSNRYVAAIDLALVLASGVGFVAAWMIVERRLLRPGPVDEPRGASATIRIVTAIGMAAAVAVVASWPPAVLDQELRSRAYSVRTQAEHADAVVPVLGCGLDAIPGSRDLPPADAPMADDPREAVVLVAGLLRPRLAVDLALPLGKVIGTPAAWLEPGDSFLPAGNLVFHDRLGDRPPEAFTILEGSQPVVVDGTSLTPLVADPASGVWVQWIQRSGAPADAPTCGGSTP